MGSLQRANKPFQILSPRAKTSFHHASLADNTDENHSEQPALLQNAEPTETHSILLTVGSTVQ